MFIDDSTPLSTANLGGAEVAASTDASQGSAYVIQVYCQTVLQTLTLVPPAVPGLPTDPELATQLAADLQTAQAHATYYLQTLNPQLMTLSSQIVGYGNQWTAMFNQLLADASNINDPAARADFISGLNLLISKARTGKLKCTQAATALSNFSSQELSVDVAAFNADFNAVNAIYGASSAEQEQLQALIDACNKGMTRDLIAMGGSAALLLVGGVACAIGLLAEIPSAGTSTALVVGGFALAAGSALAGTVAFTDWENQSKRLAQATKALSQAQAICAATQQAMNNIQSLSTACANASAAAQGLANTWDSLGADLGVTAAALGKAEHNVDSSYLMSLLNAANADWQQALAIAEQLQTGGEAALPVHITTTNNG